MVIKHNMSTQFATRQLNILEDTKGRATEKLTTGYRINKAADGAASMVVWESIRNQVKGLNQAGRNSQDGQGFINTADSGMNELTSILHRMKELCVQGANDTNTAEDREDIQMEIDALNSEINRIADETEFNTIKIFKDPYADADPGSDDWEPGGNGTEGNREFVFQVGANSEQLVRTRLPVFNTKILGTEGVNVSDSVNATSGLAVLDKSLDIVDLERSRLGAISNRLEHAYANSSNASENSQSTESVIRDTNIADEMIAYTTANIIEQADVAMIAQANGERETILAMVL
ncbi:MAG: flagellin [Lachnospiraceae bacterium]